MAFSKSVQFRGIENVLKAYNNKDVPRWALFQGNQFLEKYDGTDMKEGAQVLADFLGMIDQRSNDLNTYTLCVYDDPGEKIKNTTKYDASFNFRLVDNFEDHLQNKMSGAYEQRIAGLENRIAELTQDEPEPEPTGKDQIFAALGKILEHPQIQQVIANKILGVIDGVGDVVSGLFKKPVAAAAIGSTTTRPVVQDENQKLQQAINILATIDPTLGTNLLKLAEKVQGNPEKYNGIISMLNMI
jgi:hypothetical protein